MAPAHLQAVRDGLWMVVNEAGTGGRARIPGRDVSGKTGTSQVVGLQNKAAATARGLDTRDNGWFVFFAPRDNPRIAGVIFAEHGEHGSSAAPIAKHVMETFFAKQEGSPLPILPMPGVPAAPPVGPAPRPTAPSSTTVSVPAAPPPVRAVAPARPAAPASAPSLSPAASARPSSAARAGG
jgi:penicillin-binding protein 2